MIIQFILKTVEIFKIDLENYIKYKQLWLQ